MNYDEQDQKELPYHNIKKNSEIEYLEGFDNKLIKININPDKNRYPYCLVWSPITVISWIIPFIGHAGICTSDGIIHEFGPEHIEIEKLPFGSPTKYVLLSLNDKEKNEYNEAFKLSVEKFNKLNFNFFRYNCHSFPADVLSNIKYKGKNHYSVVDIWWMFCTQSHYISYKSFIKSYRGFVFIVCIIFLIYLIFKK